MTAVGKQCIVRRALIPDNLTWEIYDKPSKKKPSAGSDTPTPTPGGSGSGSGNGNGSNGGSNPPSDGGDDGEQ